MSHAVVHWLTLIRRFRLEFMFLTISLFLASALLIYFSCEFFVNAVEWLGRKLNLSSTATGTVLAAFGTALPESAVTFMAVVFGNPHEKTLGVGAAIGGPLVLATIAYGIVGFVLWKTKSSAIAKPGARAASLTCTGSRRLARDQSYFLVIFVFKVALGFFVFSLKPWLGSLFLLAYALYVWRELISCNDQDEPLEELAPLMFAPKALAPPLMVVIIQLVAALAVISFASHIFVNQLMNIGNLLGLAPHIVALLLSPVATELPETMNAIIWVRQGKEKLALANISGAMMIQATIPSALGIFFTPWIFDSTLTAAAVITILAILFLWFQFRKGGARAISLMSVALFYVIFLIYAVSHSKGLL